MGSESQVSIIIPFLNAEKFIEEAIGSVFAQTYKSWQLLLVDDGSTDASTQIAQRTAERHPDKVCYLDHDGHQNRGVCGSRNLGVGKATGKYVALLDADDVWLSQKLEQQVAILASQPEAGVVFGASQYWRSWTGKSEDLTRDYVPELGVQPDTLFMPPSLLTQMYPLGEASAPCPSDILLQREAIERVGGFEEDFQGVYQLYEDQAFLVKLYLSVPVFVAAECWDKYRIHPDSCMSIVARRGRNNDARLFFLNWLEEYLSGQGVQDAKVWSAIDTLRSRRHPGWQRHPHLSGLLARARQFLTQIKSST